MNNSRKNRAVARLWPLFGFLAAGFLVMGLDIADGVGFLIDVDDRMRALQIRDLVADGQWFDRRMPFIAMPQDYVSPWSRLVDLPYYLTTLALRPFLGDDAALSLARMIWPPLLFVMLGMFAVRTMRFITDGGITPVQSVLAACLMSFALWNFVPGRIDHHGLQLVLMMALLSGIADPRPVRGGLLAGVAATLSISIGLETLPFIAVALGALALVAALQFDDARLRLQALGWAFGLSALPVAFALAGPSVVADNACDALSAFWVSAILLGGAVAALTPLSWRIGVLSRDHAVVWRLASLAVPATAAGIALAVAFPACLDGPYQMIDPVSRAFWLDRVQQEGGVAYLLETGVLNLTSMLGIFALLNVLAVPVVWRGMRSGRYGLAIVWLVSAVATLAGFVQIRFITFPAAFVPLLIPLLIGTAAGGGMNWRLLGAFALPPILVMFWLTAFPPAPFTLDAFDLMADDRCKGEDMSVLAEAPAGRIMTPLGLAFAIAEEPYGHTVAALPFHRASPGIRRVALAFAGENSAERREGLEPFDYLAVCRRDGGHDLSGARLYRALVQGQDVPGLVPVNPDNASRFRLYRIDVTAPDAFALPPGGM
ncbi:hypothetical protein [Oricola cellulosilytica]|uniref:Glycosyltransferase RgtA/B/C/D-like domain-containing protein n=1 Tax=Oricola cellulosilytica TaxID=1429082 RepID=A0A4R0P2E5_9HYPH|nr:hypothetical protein [Oricola cellulosilytica]TCD10985.1 hypothetical protein E0D97_17710 [Oricola cellulosilytica]